MVKECIKKCSNNQKEKCVKLFGFKIHVPEKDESVTLALDMRKCQSAPDLISCGHDHDNVGAGYLSDGPHRDTKKRGVSWTEKEHLSFLNGLRKLGKGSWKGISRNYVHSRTATQVASHAQKYFKRLNLPDKKNKRSSLFDVSLNEPEIITPPPPEPPDNTNVKIPQQVDNLPALNANQNGDADGQANNAAKAAATPSTPPLPYTPCYGVPNFSQMPYIPMVGMSDNVQIFHGPKTFPAMPSMPMIYIPNPAYFHLLENPGSLASNALPMPTFVHGSSSTMARP